MSIQKNKLEINSQSDLIHLFSYCETELGFPGPETKIYFIHDGQTIKYYKGYLNSDLKDCTLVMEYKLELRMDLHQSLEAFTVYYFSNVTNFFGYPDDFKGAYISLNQLEKLFKDALWIISDTNRKSIEVKYEIIELLSDLGLNPSPANHNTTAFYARCPTKRGHTMMVSAKSNEYGCGYCRIKGTLAEIKREMHLGLDNMTCMKPQINANDKYNHHNDSAWNTSFSNN